MSKVDLNGKWVPTNDKELLKLFLDECKKQGIEAYSPATKVWEALVVIVDKDGLYYAGSNIMGCDKTKKLTLEDFGVKEEPIWNNKRPVDMNKEEALAFVKDFYEKDLEFRTPREWLDSTKAHGVFSLAPTVAYRVKLEPKLSEKEIKILELEETVQEALEQIKTLKGE